MSADRHRDVLLAVFAGTAKGDGRAFVAMLADDVCWEVIGTTSWSRSYAGKEAVLRQLRGPLAANFAGGNIVTAERILVDGDVAAVEGRNHSVTHAGERYANRYCWVMRFSDGLVSEIVEYCDTALIERVLPPQQAAVASSGQSGPA